MSSAFLAQIGVMLLVFGLFLIPGLFSRKMEYSDYLTLMIFPTITFVVVVVPGIIMWGFDKDSATYVLGLLVVAVVATLNYRLQPKRRAAGRAEGAADNATLTAAAAPKEG